MQSNKHRNSKRPLRPISFRLPDSYYARLAEEAARFNLSVGEYARQIVIHGMDGGSAGQLVDEVAELGTAIATLHEHLAAATVALLHDAGKADIEDAAQWVHANLISENVTRTYPRPK